MRKIIYLFIVPIAITISYGIIIYVISSLTSVIPFKEISKTGPLGDTIGGILSPLIGLITIYFVYLSYNKQQETHLLELKTSNYNTLNQALDNLSVIHDANFENELLGFLVNAYTTLEKTQTSTGQVIIEYKYIKQFHERAYHYTNNYKIVDKLISSLKYAKVIIEGYNKFSITKIQEHNIAFRINKYILSESIQRLFWNIKHMPRPDLNDPREISSLCDLIGLSEDKGLYQRYRNNENEIIALIEDIFKYVNPHPNHQY